MTILVKVDVNNVVEGIHIPLNLNHLEAIKENDNSLIEIETELNLQESNLVGGYKVLENKLVKLTEEIQKWEEENQIEPEPNKIDILKAELLDANKVILDLQLQILTQSI